VWQFRALFLVIVVLGTITSIFYISAIKEVFLTEEAKRLEKIYKKSQGINDMPVV
jgi:hypothetical protein